MQYVPLTVQCEHNRVIMYKNFIITTKLICTINFLKICIYKASEIAYSV
jgi:hypothetical protein